MAELNGREFNNWEEFIYYEFPDNEFGIEVRETESNRKEILVTSRHQISKTIIVFYFVTPEYCRAFFYHPNSPHHNANNEKEKSGEIGLDDYDFTTENMVHLKNILDIPVKHGWTEKTTQFKGKLKTSEIRYYDGLEWQIIPIGQNISWFNKAGCLLILFAWPILLIRDKLVQVYFRHNKKHFSHSTSCIPPMKE